MQIFKRIFHILSSLKLAVLVILALAVALAAATVIESLYDTPTARYWVYGSTWFFGLLAALAVNIFCVAMSRYPWKAKHIPFLLAHAGILILLAGSWITERAGVDGTLRVSEGETASVVDLDHFSLLVMEKDEVFSVPISWIPPEVTFQPFSLAGLSFPNQRTYDIKVDQYLAHADPTISFIPNPANPEEERSSVGSLASSALHFRVTGGPMGISQDLWLWEGDAGWKSIQAGPAHFSLGSFQNEGQDKDLRPRSDQPSLAFQSEKGGDLSYVAISSSGKRVQGRIRKAELPGKKIHPGWKGDVVIEVLEWIPQAMPLTTYQLARVLHGAQAPTSAIHLVASGAGVWLGLGDRATIHLGDREIGVGYFPKRVVLPFSLRLDRFTVEHDPGTANPASYASNVSVLEGQTASREARISMNEPLQVGGYTVYQASYEEGIPRPTVSIFSVNHDPGRIWKYFGSLLIVSGSILLFAAKYRRRKVKAPVVEAVELELAMKPEFLKR